MKVLIVDDIFTNRLLLAEVLRSLDIEFDQAENGKEALDLANKYHFKLVLMDIKMPVMDGLQATVELRKTRTSQDLPIIAFSANNNQNDIEHCLAAGMQDFLSKPIDSEALRLKIEKWVST